MGRQWQGADANEAEGFTKVIIGDYGEILGAVDLWADATNLITEYSLAMRAELTADEVLATIHPHPTYSEALREATLAAEGRPIHIFQRQAALTPWPPSRTRGRG